MNFISNLDFRTSRNHAKRLDGSLDSMKCDELKYLIKVFIKFLIKWNVSDKHVILKEFSQQSSLNSLGLINILDPKYLDSIITKF